MSASPEHLRPGELGRIPVQRAGGDGLDQRVRHLGHRDRLVLAAGQAVHHVPAGEAGAAGDRDPHRPTSAGAGARPPPSPWSRVPYRPTIVMP
jgi:hypothetical protein